MDEDIPEKVTVFFSSRLTSFLKIDRYLMKSNQRMQPNLSLSVVWDI